MINKNKIMECNNNLNKINYECDYIGAINHEFTFIKGNCFCDGAPYGIVDSFNQRKDRDFAIKIKSNSEYISDLITMYITLGEFTTDAQIEEFKQTLTKH